jgi:hypothetical protein
MLEPELLNFAEGNFLLNRAALSFVNRGVSHKLFLRNEQQNLQEAQSDFERIFESITLPFRKIYQALLLVCKTVLPCVVLQHPYLLLD